MERQSILKEVANNQNLQYLIDRTADRFRPVLWPNFFAWRDTTSISYETLIGDAANAAAASVVSYDSAAPLRTRKAIRKLTGEIPSIREKFQMTEKDLQEYLRMTAVGGDFNSILRLIFDDVQMAGEAPHKRLDIFALEALSTGEITLDTTKNPDGIITESAIDFGMPAGNKLVVSGATWSTGGATAKPITDVMAVVEAATAKGVVLDRMFMRRSTFNYFRAADETVSYVTGFKIGANQNKVNLNLTTVNEFLLAEGLPRIIILDASVGIETDGVVTAFNPFVDNMVAFVPAGLLGDMLNAPIVERLFPAKHVSYAEYNRVLLKKWSDTDPIAEYTACELNAFPSWKNVDKCFILDSETT